LASRESSKGKGSTAKGRAGLVEEGGPVSLGFVILLANAGGATGVKPGRVWGAGGDRGANVTSWGSRGAESGTGRAGPKSTTGIGSVTGTGRGGEIPAVLDPVADVFWLKFSLTTDF